MKVILLAVTSGDIIVSLVEVVDIQDDDDDVLKRQPLTLSSVHKQPKSLLE